MYGVDVWRYVYGVDFGGSVRYGVDVNEDLRALVCKNQTYRGNGGKFDFFLILMLDRLDYN